MCQLAAVALTERQQAVSDRLAAGESQSTISRALGISRQRVSQLRMVVAAKRAREQVAAETVNVGGAE